MGRRKVPFDELKKCEANIGKDIQITMHSGRIVKGSIWGVFYQTKPGLDHTLQVRVWNGGLASKNRMGLPSGNVVSLRSSQIEKFEYLWEQSDGIHSA